MPIYEYFCPSCKVTKTALRSISERHNTVHCDFCPSLMNMSVSVPNPAVVQFGTHAQRKLK